MIIDAAPAVLEDDDVLKMVNSGLAPLTVVDGYRGEKQHRAKPRSGSEHRSLWASRASANGVLCSVATGSGYLACFVEDGFLVEGYGRAPILEITK